MLEFRPIEIDDRDEVQTLICASGCHGADYSFANLYIWRKIYKPLVAFMDTRMLLYLGKPGFYAYPKGDGDPRPSIEYMREEAHRNGAKLVMRGLTPKTLEELQEYYGEDAFAISEDRDNADYIYTTDKLRYLKGRKLSSKRNHLKHFERNGPWHYDKVTQENLAEARAFVEEFYQEKDDPDLAAESVAIGEMFDNYETLGFMGGLLFQNDRAVAFTAGTRLDQSTIDVHFEKALPGVEGAYTMINYQFANMVAEENPDILYFNREEDMGLPGLRKAKESYHPDVLLMKYYAEEK
ncbi:DUF2156 domain-containing protein [Mobilibacterium timonense]|uniref:DUF2156 domain-containing protein n=1 Tax=Mobilibacterium timonense TaxID=1871012 RepID=UPI002352D417|nr:phosphatidylglycerol lysyltransferase domain-containing protein [Mobilibacterium timonense]MBM6991573.1 DUF2156 domain-containing protein [Mobilibacterium timonense]